jgi:hypothetical protein
MSSIEFILSTAENYAETRQQWEKRFIEILNEICYDEVWSDWHSTAYENTIPTDEYACILSKRAKRSIRGFSVFLAKHDDTKPPVSSYTRISGEDMSDPVTHFVVVTETSEELKRWMRNGKNSGPV